MSKRAAYFVVALCAVFFSVAAAVAGGGGFSGSSGGTTITDTLAFTGTGTNTITSATTDATTSTTVAAITLRSTENIGNSDLVVNIEDSAGTNLFTVNESGAVVATSMSIGAGQFTAGSVFDSGGNQRFSLAADSVSTVLGRQADGSSSVGVILRSSLAYTTAGALIASLRNANVQKASVDLNGFYVQPVQTVTVADDGAGTTPAMAITPSSNIIKAACNDATGCTPSISETGAQEGSLVYITHTGSGGPITATDSAGVLEGACTLTSPTDMWTVLYINSAWHTQNCQDNVP